MSEQGFHRCRHCRGFYETNLPKCKWCSYETRFSDASGKPVLYVNREAVRALQMAEYEQLPEKVRSDPMGPPSRNLTLLCACLHCGPTGHEFEAIEMRWITNERMWACPCTTCGGRGFQFDIHPSGPVWECAECKHWYRPEKFTSKYAVCPLCGSRFANGWYDDEDENGEPVSHEEGADDGDQEDEVADLLGEQSTGATLTPEDDEDEIPWEDSVTSFDPFGNEGAFDGEPESNFEDGKDDIDYPRSGIPEKEDDEEGDSDIPY